MEEHNEMVTIGGRDITCLRFADETNAFAENEQALTVLVESLEKT